MKTGSWTKFQVLYVPCRRVSSDSVELPPSIDDLHTAAAFVGLLLTVFGEDRFQRRFELGVAKDFLRKD